jgi:hypothetical protein
LGATARQIEAVCDGGVQWVELDCHALLTGLPISATTKLSAKPQGSAIGFDHRTTAAIQR